MRAVEGTNGSVSQMCQPADDGGGFYALVYSSVDSRPPGKRCYSGGSRLSALFEVELEDALIVTAALT